MNLTTLGKHQSPCNTKLVKIMKQIAFFNCKLWPTDLWDLDFQNFFHSQKSESQISVAGCWQTHTKSNRQSTWKSQLLLSLSFQHMISPNCSDSFSLHVTEWSFVLMSQITPGEVPYLLFYQLAPWWENPIYQKK